MARRKRWITMDCNIYSSRVASSLLVRKWPVVEPRAAAEIVAGDGSAVIAGTAQVKTREGNDVSGYFLAGAVQALVLCRQHDISTALLTELSPSCGSGRIYDGSFTRQSITASGVTTALLQQHGVKVFNQFQIDEALNHLTG
jgi:uncharacterized protein YbbK (DUF523 family)